MNKLLATFLLFLVFLTLSNTVFAQVLECRFGERKIEGVESVVIDHDQVIINETVSISLEKSVINCSNFGRQLRFDGDAQGYRVILKTCTTEAELEGVLIDNIKQEAGDIFCN